MRSRKRAKLLGIGMFYRKRSELTIIDLSKYNAEKISYEVIAEIILDKPSNIIYCEAGGKLQGIISMGDVGRAVENGEGGVAVNRSFTSVLERESMRARNIFRTKSAINEIPVISENGELVGDYLRWDDLHMLEIYLRGGRLPVCSGYKHIALIRPCFSFEEKQSLFHLFYSFLMSREEMKVECIEYNEIGLAGDVDMFLVVDEEECRALETLAYLRKKSSGKEDSIVLKQELFITYKNFLCKTGHWIIGEHLKLLRGKGIHILNLHFDFRNSYWQRLSREIEQKYSDIGEKVSNQVYPSMYGSFFDDLYSEEYANSIMDINFSVDSKSICGKLSDCKSRLYNVSNGERYTDNQPAQYYRTIYFVGPCFIYGYFVEDRYTIESLLQKRLNEVGCNIRAVNCGSVAYNNDRKPAAELARIMDLPLKEGDMVVVYAANRHLKGIPEIDLMDALEEYKVPAQWLTESPEHCNHKVNSLYAEAIYDALKPVLEETVPKQRRPLEYNGDCIKKLYSECYFADFDPLSYEKIGAIVMNCNPFTYGHRYLIEQALSMVDLLIIFVVEEDKSLFSFSERYAMVYKGIEDLENVMVVPSGPFILSQTTFPEYFVKETDEDIVRNVENDITIFAEQIAPLFNIKYRFVGEEPQDEVTNEYNLAMKRILPRNGIQLVELPRRELYSRPISASWVRECLEKNDMGMLDKLVPQSTKRIAM